MIFPDHFTTCFIELLFYKVTLTEPRHQTRWLLCLQRLKFSLWGSFFGGDLLLFHFWEQVCESRRARLKWMHPSRCVRAPDLVTYVFIAGESRFPRRPTVISVLNNNRTRWMIPVSAAWPFRAWPPRKSKHLVLLPGTGVYVPLICRLPSFHILT